MATGSNRSDYTVNIDGDAKGLDAATQAGAKAIRRLTGDTKKAFSGLGDQIFSLRGAITGLIGGFSLKAVIDASIEAERTAALLTATLRATGRQSEFTTAQLLDMAGALQKVTTFGDEAIAQAQTSLLRFGRITGQTFQDATKAALDLSTATGQDLAGAAAIVGRALQDPAKAAEQLRSVNILLSKSQAEVLAKLVATGKTAEAQQIILGKLERAYGGAAEAARNSFGGALTGLKEAAGDLLEGDGGNLEDARIAVEQLTATLQSPEVKRGFAVATSGVITLVEWLAKLVGLLATSAQKFGEFAAKVDLGTSGFQKIRLLTQLLNPLTAGKAVREIGQIGRRPGPGDLAPGAETPAAVSTSATGGPGGSGPPAEEADGPTEAEISKAVAAAKKRASAVATAEAAVFKAQADRNRATLEALNAQNLLSVRDYHAQKLQLELDAIDREIAARRTAMATADADERIRLRGELEALGTQRLAAIEQSARDQAAAEKQLADERTALELRLLEATGRGTEARAQAIEHEFAELIARLKAQGDEAGVAIAVELKGVELARTEFGRLEQQLDEAQARYQRRLQEIDVAVSTGASTRSRARRDQVDAAQVLVAEEERIADALAEQAAIIGDPELAARVRDLRQEILITGQVTEEALNQVKGAAEDGFVGLFEDLQREPAKAADAVENMVSSINASIQRIIAQRLGEQLVDSLFGALQGGGGGGGGGGLFDVLGSLAGSLFGKPGFSSSGTVTTANQHSGGLLGFGGGAPRRVPAITFADAPRLHNGGMLGRDEVPIIGLKGERVLNREETRNYNAAIASPPVVNVNISAPDPNAFRVARPQVEASIGSALERAMRRNR